MPTEMWVTRPGAAVHGPRRRIKEQHRTANPSGTLYCLWPDRPVVSLWSECPGHRHG